MSESLRCVMVPLNNQLDRIYSLLGDGPLGMPLGNCMLIGVGRQGTALQAENLELCNVKDMDSVLSVPA